MMRISAIALLISILFVPVVGCELAGGRHEQHCADLNGTAEIVSNSDLYFVAYLIRSSDPNAAFQVPPLNEAFDIKLIVFDRPGTKALTDVELSVDAAMPEHMHGMNVQPKITRQKDGSFLAEGMLFHMPGRWELYFDITRNGVTERAQTEITLE